jgi:hypothetical protein
MIGAAGVVVVDDSVFARLRLFFGGSLVTFRSAFPFSNSSLVEDGIKIDADAATCN